MSHQSAADFMPDPFEVQIGAMIVVHRAALLPLDAMAKEALVETSKDFFWYGERLAKLRGESPPWDASSTDEQTPPEVFFQSDEFIGHTESMPNPSLGMCHRHFRLLRRDAAAFAKCAPMPVMSGALAVVQLVQHPDKRWQVLHAEVGISHRRQGIATMLYDHIEVILDTKLVPSGWLSEDGYRFWKARGSRFIGWYRQIDLFPGLWISPKVLLTLRATAAARLEEVRRNFDPRPS